MLQTIRRTVQSVAIIYFRMWYEFAASDEFLVYPSVPSGLKVSYARLENCAKNPLLSNEDLAGRISE